MNKICKKCLLEKDEKEFGSYKRLDNINIFKICKTCHSEQIRKQMLGTHQSKETIEKRAKANKQKILYNILKYGKGRNPEVGKNISKSLTGKKQSLERRQAQSMRLIGKKLSLSHAQHIGQGNIGKHKITPIHQNKLLNGWRNYIVNNRESHSQMCSNRQRALEEHGYNGKKQFKPELKMKEFLVNLNLKEGVDFIHHKWIKDIPHQYVCDFYLPKIKTVIECDGDFFHGNDKHIKDNKPTYRQQNYIVYDNFRNNELRDKGYVVLRFWEHDIMKNSVSVLDALRKFFNIFIGGGIYGIIKKT